MTDAEVDRDRIGSGVRSVERPTTAEAARAVEAAIRREAVVSLVGVCGVVHPGYGRLPPGPRHVLLKPDGSAVVHGRDGTAPDVVLAGEGEPTAAVADGDLVIAATGVPASGRLRFERVDQVVTATVEPSIDGTEPPASAGGADGHDGARGRHDEIRELLLSAPDRVEPGFRPLATERETSAGSVDLYGRDADGRAVVVEIKGDRAGPAAVGQLDRYVAALRRDLHANAEVRGVLVAPSATERTRRLLDERGFSFRALSPGR